MQEQKINHNIQALRALAIILVIIQHLHRLPVPDWLMVTYSKASYWTGVDIFLAISGFLMCKSLENEIRMKGRTFSAFMSFFVKRFFRLIPTLLFWCLACIIISALISPFWGTGVTKSIDTLLYSLTGTSNIFFFKETINSISYDPLLSVTWSLSLEWQLYFILALLALTLKNNIFIISLILIIAISSIFLPNGVNHQESIGWWIRPQAFFLGSLIFILKEPLKKKVSNHLLIAILSILSFLSLIYLTSIIHPSIKLLFIGLMGASCFALLGVCAPAFSAGILNWIGDRSYSIYLCHIPVMVVLRKFLDEILASSLLFHSVLFYFLAFLIALAIISSLSYNYIEKPFISFYKSKLTRQLAN